MATSKFTDFSEYAIGSQPSDWTVTLGDADKWKVAADEAATGGKVLHHESGSNQTALGWDVADDGETIHECVARIKLTAFGSTAQAAGLTLRDDGSPTASLLHLLLEDRIDGLIVYEGVTALGTHALSIDAGTWYWMRFRVEGTAWKAKVWTGSADDEPEAWSIEGDDPVDVTAGRMGVVATWFKVMDVDVFGFGTAGESAPTAPIWVQDAEPVGSWVQD
jgi:hypothetical protein